MSVHPFIRPEQTQKQAASDEQYRGFPEQFWKDEDDHSRPPPVWAGVFVLVLLGLLFVVGSFVVWVL